MTKKNKELVDKWVGEEALYYLMNWENFRYNYPYAALRREANEKDKYQFSNKDHYFTKEYFEELKKGLENELN